MKAEQVSYAKLEKLLRGLDFQVTVKSSAKIKAFRHNQSQTIVLLTDKRPDDWVRSADVISVKRHLHENGIMEEEKFDAWLAAA